MKVYYMMLFIFGVEKKYNIFFKGINYIYVCLFINYILKDNKWCLFFNRVYIGVL